MPDIDLADHGFGLFGPDFGVPQGGFCLSAFLTLERDGLVLVGRMDETHADTWIDRWAPNVAFYDGKRYERLFEGLRLPATYLNTGEHPDHAIQRVLQGQLDLDEPHGLADPDIVTSAKDSRRAPEARHWDVLFSYTAQGPPIEAIPDHWASLKYRDPDELDADDFVMLHGELLEAF